MAKFNNPTYPHWFMTWRRVAYGAAALLIGSLVITILVIYVDGQTFPQSLNDNPQPDLTPISVLVLILLSVGFGNVMVIAAGLAGNAFAGNGWSTVQWSKLFQVNFLNIAAVGLFIVAVTFGGPVIGRTYRQVMSAECYYRFKVVAFSDLNQNGQRNPNEPGLANIALTQTARFSSQPLIQSGITDSDGAFLLDRVYGYCPTSHDTITINIQTPDGYYETTPTTFSGPFTAASWAYPDAVQTVYFGFVKSH